MSEEFRAATLNQAGRNKLARSNKMKLKCTNLLVLTLALTCLFTGCRKRPTSLTALPNPRTHVGEGTGPGPGPGFTPGTTPDVTPSGIQRTSKDWWSNGVQDRETLKADIVYFDFDSSAIKASEKSKIQAVADFVRNNSGAD